MDDIKIKSFKERVVMASIEASKLYKKHFLDYEYIIFSDSFGMYGQKIKAEKGNFMHLIGINSKVKPTTFFEKCINENLDTSDFDFHKKYQSEKSVKGSVREKIKIISDAMRMFDKELSVEKNFVKNRVTCSFATSENTFTIGFVESGRPMTLMRNNQLDEQKRNIVELLLKKRRDCKFYSIVYGANYIEKYLQELKQYISYIKMAIEINNNFISRSEAKEVVEKIKKFNDVVLDFENVEWIGNSFAHELFVVYINYNPKVKLYPVNMNNDVRKMYNHALSIARSVEKEKTI